MSDPEKKHIITIAGKPGSGKSTTGKLVASELGFGNYSTGDRFRQLIKESGLDLLAGSHQAEVDSRVDRQIDEETILMGSHRDELVIDSRMAWHFIPNSFKVYLDLDIETAARRIIANKTADATRNHTEYVPDDLHEYTERLNARLASERKRYKALYGADPYDTSNYDLVVNTRTHDAHAVAALILDGYQSWLNS